MLFGQDDLPSLERLVNACEIFWGEIGTIVNASQVSLVVIDSHPFLPCQHWVSESVSEIKLTLF